jgi:hypothetical protein
MRNECPKFRPSTDLEKADNGIGNTLRLLQVLIWVTMDLHQCDESSYMFSSLPVDAASQ